MSKTRILLGSALALSLAAFMSAVTKPRPVIPKPGQVWVSKGGGVRIEARPSHTAVHENGSELFAELTVTLDDRGEEKTDQPISLALVLDTSGSMSGSKMEDARKAAHRLVDLLSERDELSLSAFGTEITAFGLRKVDAESKASFHAAIDALQAAGSTNISGGVTAGWGSLRAATGAKRLVLVSDGQPTVGMLTQPELAALVGRVHDEAITLTALGVGADIDGALMLHLSERGGGMYGYLKDAGALEEILGREVTAARSAIARNVELRFDTTGLRVAEAPGRHLEFVNGHPVLHLADLRRNLPTRVLVRLESMPACVGEVASLGATVSWRSRGGPIEHRNVGFETVVVEDAEAAAHSRDEAVFSRGIGAVGNLKLVAAAAAWERGDTARAGSLLDDAKALFGTRADALAGETQVNEVRQGLHRLNNAQEKREYARGLERKKLTDFGLENSGY